ncbi:Deoxymugineic acid synthase 1 [Seminavis robusta]|uniref:Deoxymugineic acid synthase 1 n=1 Tax=Seminavis robusta TaxID=568900 RepID=A0A9N8HAL2_9STRA|nr:Deoxymugineic acid synthase 1 [Seminavis robusta]|eukprot:Sro229_g092910.1 Deoxymugineic acid synthase 1 (457) ;mRNA; f:16779-18149
MGPSSPSTSRNTRPKHLQTMATTDNDNDTTGMPEASLFQATHTADDATSLTDGVLLNTPNTCNNPNVNKVILPWIGFGTYKLGKEVAYEAVLTALECGYRCIDTAFIYGGETTERLVGNAIQTAIHDKKILSSRKQVFVVTKHWRKYHGYEETLQCLKLSLKRLQLDYVDLYLMHWPGPAWKTMNRRNDVIESQGPWHYAKDNLQPEEMARLRSETWRAMEDAARQGKCKSIGVSNFTVEHLKALKQTATIWPPAVNQVEFHPLYPQTELLDYCRQEGIVLQAYASLGGQDTGKKQWNKLALEALPPTITTTMDSQDGDASNNHKRKKQKKQKLRDTVVSLLSCRPVVAMAQKQQVTPAQILLRWALSQNCVVIPKSTSKERMIENAEVLSFALTVDEISEITTSVQQSITKSLSENQANNKELNEVDISTMERCGIGAMGRLCWRNDPLRQLDFD